MNTISGNTQADKVLEAHIQDLVMRSSRDCTMYCTRFLDERQVYLAEKYMKGRSDCRVMLWGGYKEAQRKMLCICPEWMEPDTEDVPAVCLTFRYRETDKLTHRDFLGAFMSCGIQRETVGDIVTGCGKTQAIVTEAVAPLLRELEKIGRCGVRVSDEEPFDMPAQQNFREISGTISSMRIDAAASLAVRESREKTVRMLQQGKIEVNYCQVTSPSYAVNEGDIFVVKGCGKFRIKNVTGLSKKGRLHIVIEQYN